MVEADSEVDPPQSPADPRPDNEPYYIDSKCPECGVELVLADEHPPTGDGDGPRVAPEVWESYEQVWHDEWVCPSCEDGIHLDTPSGSERE